MGRDSEAISVGQRYRHADTEKISLDTSTSVAHMYQHVPFSLTSKLKWLRIFLSNQFQDIELWIEKSILENRRNRKTYKLRSRKASTHERCPGSKASR
jgi:ABC-type histidine transport system ATPase subunit